MYQVLIFLCVYTCCVFATPPSCFISCINEISRTCPRGHIDIEAHCSKEDSMIGCLVDICPYGTFNSARDHFLGTCLEHGAPTLSYPNPPASKIPKESEDKPNWRGEEPKLKPNPNLGVPSSAPQAENPRDPLRRKPNVPNQPKWDGPTPPPDSKEPDWKQPWDQPSAPAPDWSEPSPPEWNKPKHPDSKEPTPADNDTDDTEDSDSESDSDSDSDDSDDSDENDDERYHTDDCDSESEFNPDSHESHQDRENRQGHESRQKLRNHQNHQNGQKSYKSPYLKGGKYLKTLKAQTNPTPNERVVAPPINYVKPSSKEKKLKQLEDQPLSSNPQEFEYPKDTDQPPNKYRPYVRSFKLNNS